MRYGIQGAWLAIACVVMALCVACGGGSGNDAGGDNGTQASPSAPANEHPQSQPPAEPAPPSADQESQEEESVDPTPDPTPEPSSDPEPQAEAGHSDPDHASAAQELRELVERLDFTAARVLAAQLAQRIDDPQLQAHYNQLAQTYSTYIQESPQLREMFVFLAGNRQQQQRAMSEIFSQGDLAHLFMDAIILPEVDVTSQDDEILPIVLELARALNHHQSFAPALRRHVALPPGEMRIIVAEHISQLMDQDPAEHATALQKHILRHEAKDVADLLPQASQLVLAELADEGFDEDLREVIVSAADAVGSDDAALRGAVFEAAAVLGDIPFSERVTEVLGAGRATMAGLPPGWSGSDLGEVPEPGSVSFENGRFILRAGGADYWGDRDNGFWVWRKVSGDVSLRAYIHSIQGVHEHTKAGIAFRASNTGESRHASVVVSAGDDDPEEAKRFVLGSRSEDGGSSNNDGNTNILLPHWVQLHRQGDEVIAEVSQDGENWEELSRMTLDLGDEFYIGLVLSARHDSDIAEAEMEVPLEDLF
ncbi:MAG: hypothetical protein EA401_07560 [Planctomycetota bacterium]|nr:MAG: hypothetical protein EA401_07560 [Planctomycetota bacterium]